MLNLDEYVKSYVDLLIRQYRSKPNAKAEVELIAQTVGRTAAFISEFSEGFDVDVATHDRLDKIGKIVGISRTIPNAFTPYRFSFSRDSDGGGFGSVFNESIGAPFASIFDAERTDLRLDDEDFRLFIKAKIALNNGAGYMVSDDYISMQDVIETLFNGRGYVIDNYDMTLTLFVPFDVPQDRLELILQLNLLPRSQTVRYSQIVWGESDSFGFASDVGAKGFGSLTDPEQGGSLARLFR